MENMETNMEANALGTGTESLWPSCLPHLCPHVQGLVCSYLVHIYSIKIEIQVSKG